MKAHHLQPIVRSLELRGKEGMEFLQRITTADLSKVGIGDSQLTCFLNEKGKLVDVASIQRMDLDIVKIHSMKGDQLGLVQWIEKFIIMEDLEIIPIPEPYYRISIFPDEKGGTTYRDASSANLNEMSVLFGSTKFSGEADVEDVDDEEYHRLRVEYLIAEWGYELSAERNPLEVNLQALISNTKGCYVGQEVIARLETYQRIQFVLQRFTVNETKDLLGEDIYNTTGSKVGWVTTSVASHMGTSVGLAIMKPQYANGSYLTLENNHGQYLIVK